MRTAIHYTVFAVVLIAAIASVVFEAGLFVSFIFGMLLAITFPAPNVLLTKPFGIVLITLIIIHLLAFIAGAMIHA